MVVYGEYLFIENMITGMVLLFMTAKMTGSRMKGWRLVLGGVSSGICAFSIFIPTDIFSAFLLRGAMAVGITWIVLGREHLIKKTAVFLIVTFLSGGTVMAFFSWQGIPSLSGNGALYMGAVTYIKLIVFGSLAMGLVYWFIRLIKNQRRVDLVQGKVCLEIENRRYSLRAFVDSGNCLREPLTGNPVILIDEKGQRQLDFTEKDFPDRFMVIPYEAVGVSKGILTGTRLDKIIFEEKDAESVILAYYKGNFDGFEVLLNQDILEGRLLENA